VAIAHDANTRFPTTDGTVGVNSVDTTTGDRTFSHAGAATAKGAVVVVLCTGNTAVVSGVLYGGVAMALTQTAVDATEAGRVDIYVLDDQASFPTGTQTVTLQGCTATQKWATCSTVTCSVGSRSKLNASNFKDTTAAANPTLTVVTSTNPTMLYGGLHGGDRQLHVAAQQRLRGAVGAHVAAHLRGRGRIDRLRFLVRHIRRLLHCRGGVGGVHTGSTHAGDHADHGA
jgi:hypothetical protein